jgi:hypothetical protein
LTVGPKLAQSEITDASALRELIAHRDDDDYSAPGRLADQVQRLTESGKAVTGFRSMRFTDAVRWWKYEGTRNYALGTSLWYQRDWWSTHRFSGISRRRG